MGWFLIVLATLAIVGVLAWRWAVANQSVATLDRLDNLLRSSEVQLSGGPIDYGAHRAQKLYVHTQANASGAGPAQPVLVWIHGGSWATGDPKDYSFIGRSLAPHGYVVVNAGYRLDQDGKFPAMLEDGAAAIKWVTDNIARFGGDPERIFLIGHSAGAYNAVMLGLDRQWLEREGLDENTIDGVIGLAGPYDFLPLDGEGVERAFGEAPQLDLTQPVNFARPDAPPMLLVTGDQDTVVRPRNTQSLAKALTDAGRPTEPMVLQGVDHIAIMTALARPFDRDTRVKDALLEFLENAEASRLARARPSGANSSVQVQGGNR